MVVQQRDAQIGNPVISSVGICFTSDLQSSRATAPAPVAAPSYPQQPSYQQPQQPSYQPPQQSYQQPQQPYQQAPRSGGSGGNYTVDTSRFNQVPISAIHPYLDRNWFIRVS